MSYNSELQANNEDLLAILNKVIALPDISNSGEGGVQLPELGDREAQPYEISLNKQLINSDGEVITGTLSEYKNGDSVPGVGETTLLSDPGVTKFRIGTVYSPNNVGDDTKGCIVRPGAVLEPTNIPTSLFGTATPDKVVKGFTFTSETGLLVPGEMEIAQGVVLPKLNPPGSEDDLLEGVQLIGQDGSVVDGRIPQKNTSDVIVSGNTVTIPAGYYKDTTTQSVKSTTIATPSISVDEETGEIVATSTQTEGYILSGTANAREQLMVQEYQEITPSEEVYKIPAGRFLTGDQIILWDENIKSENIRNGISIYGVDGGFSAVVEALTVTENGTYSPPHGVDGYSQVTVEVATDANFVIDSELSKDSENPVQNKAIYNAIAEKSQVIICTWEDGD